MKMVGLTHRGMVRKNNEDAYAIDESLNLFIVADGMGGHAAGEVAAHLAVKTVVDFIRQTDGWKEPHWPLPTDRDLPFPWQQLQGAVMAANAVIYREATTKEELFGMGTTLVALRFLKDEALYAHVGDSRLYLFRQGNLGLLTEDHSWVQEQIGAGNLTEEEAQTHPLRNVVTRALGSIPNVKVDLNSLIPQKGDLFLLCTDGLITMVTHEEIQSIIQKYRGDLDMLATQLIEEANRKGGLDNTTVILVEYDTIKGEEL